MKTTIFALNNLILIYRIIIMGTKFPTVNMFTQAYNKAVNMV